MVTEENSLLIVWHSRTGASRQLAQAAARGARASLRQDGGRERAVRVDLVHARAADAHRVLAAGAYIFIAPENLGSLSGLMKEFFDRTYYGVIDRVEGRPYAVIVAAGSDGHGAARQVERIATGWRLKPVAEPMIVNTDAQTASAILAPKRLPVETLARAADLGAAMAQGLAMGIF
jgi:NAD(P)H-dependent FMN reductase